MPILEHARDDHQRVTAGIPSLSANRRRSISEFYLKQAYQRALQAEYFRNEATAKAPDNGRDVTDYEQMIGIPLVGARIIARLKRLNSNLWFEESHADPSKMGCYVLKNDFKGGQTKEFICGFEKEVNPEFSVRVTDDEGNAKGIIGGWRRVLMKLIRVGLISESKAHAIFGPPSRDSENWARFTQ